MAFLQGTDDNDFLHGTRFDDKLLGLEGDDNLLALGGGDHITGDRSSIPVLPFLTPLEPVAYGDDFLLGGSGADILPAIRISSSASIQAWRDDLVARGGS